MSSSLLSRRAFAAATVIAAVTAALAAAASLHLSLPVWAMFIGWIAFFTRIGDVRTAAENLACVGLGVMIGAVAASTIPFMTAITGPMIALPMVVFVVALVVVALRGLPVMNNLLGYFLGLVAWFAGHLEPSLEGIASLIGATAVGSAAGWVSHNLPARLVAREAVA